MSQSSINLSDQTGYNYVQNINAALQAVATDFSGSTAPTETYANMKWRDTSVSPSVVKIRNATNTAWVSENSTLPDTGITAGTYRSLTIGADGRATAGTNPATLSGYGITDATPATSGLTAEDPALDSEFSVYSGSYWFKTTVRKICKFATEIYTVARVSGTGSAARTLLSFIKDSPVTPKDFGAVGDGTTDDTTAFQNMVAYIISSGRGEILIPKGTYKVSSAINITGLSNVIIRGEGVDSSILSTSSATANVFYDSGVSYWRTFRDFTVTSSVTKTAGAHFYLTGEKRGLFDRIKVTKHFNGFNFVGFEQTELRSCSVTTPSGAGAAIICGTVGSAGSGANLLINSCFLRGQNDITQSNTLGNYGIVVNDVDAVWGFNTDVGAFLVNDMLIQPSTRSANHFFTQCFFDATQSSDCIRMMGNGTKQQITFSACWVASAGKLSGATAEVCGFRATNSGTYQDIIFSGTRFYNSSGSGVFLEMPSADFNFNGCNFLANGATSSVLRYGLFWSPASSATNGITVVGCIFEANNAPNDMRLESNCAKYSIIGNKFGAGLSNASAGSSGFISKNIGYNNSSSSVGVSASPFSYSNNSGDTQVVVVAGGSVSSITLNGVTVGNSSNMSICVPNGSTVAVVYSSTPTIYAVGV